MQYLGADAQQVQQQVAAQQQKPDENALAKLDGNSIILIGTQDRNWRRVRLALDRVGLNVIGEDAGNHLYLVEVAAAEAASVTNQKPGMFSRLFGRSKKKQQVVTHVQQPRLAVQVLPLQGGGTRVSLYDETGAPYQGKDAKTWLKQLNQQLR